MKMYLTNLLALVLLSNAYGQKIPEIGIATPIANDSIVYLAGYKYIGEGVARMVSPRLSDAEFQENKRKVQQARCKVYMCNVFFPSDIKIAGKDVDEAKVLSHAEGVFKRANILGIEAIVLGSGNARKIEEDIDKDKAISKFIALAKKMAVLAQQNNVKIFLENLNSTETNFMTTLADAAKIVRKVNHPNFRLNADIYHMLKESESPNSILNAADVISYVEVAEKEGRTRPGVHNENFLPYFKVLKQINYKGKIFIEGRWTNLEEEASLAKSYLENQLKLAYAD